MLWILSNIERVIDRFLVILLIVNLNTYSSIGQTQTPSKTADSLIVAKIDSLFTSKLLPYFERMDSIQTRNKCAAFYIQKKSTDSMFISSSKTKCSYKFDSAHFKIFNGRLIGTQLFLRDTSKDEVTTIFFNRSKKLPLGSNQIANKVKRYTLKNNCDSEESILLKDYFLIYPNLNIKGNDFYPSDTCITFKNNREYLKEILSYQPKLENYVEFDLLSDIEGLSSEKPNGLIQLEGRASLTLNKRYFLNSNIRALYNVVPFIQFNKIDDNNRNLPVIVDTAGRKYLNTFNLWQYSNLTFGIKLNIVRWNSQNSRSNVFLDATTMIIRTSISDSIPKLVSSNVYSFIWGLAMKYRICPINNVPFWSDFSFGICNLTLLNQDIEQQSSSMYKPELISLPKSYEPEEKLIFIPQIELFFKPTDSRTKYFVRFSFPTDLSKSKNNFLQIQLGVSIMPKDLNNYLKLKGI